MATATLNTRLQATCLAVALVLAQLLWAYHGAEALAHEPGEICDLCACLTDIGHALADVAGAAPVLDPAAVDPQPYPQALPANPAQAQRARSPPYLRS